MIIFPALNMPATGAGDFDCYLGCPVMKEIQTDISELILRYLETHSPIEIPPVRPLTVPLSPPGLRKVKI